MLKNRDIDIPFCVCWANEPWTRAWVGETKVLIPQLYGEKREWKEHFDYLLPFFKDSRYICDDGKPLVVIYRPEVIECLNEMLDYWNELAIQEGFEGLTYAYQNIDFDLKADKMIHVLNIISNFSLYMLDMICLRIIINILKLLEEK